MTRPAAGAPRLGSFLRERELWLLLLTVLLFFARPLTGGTLFFRDLYLLFFPQRQRLVKLLAAGGLPLWDPFLHGGQPFVADPNNAALYPSGLLSLLLPPVFAFNLEIALHFALCALGAYLLARTLGLSRAAGLIAGALFAFAGFTLSLGNLFNRLLAMPWLAFLLLFWHLYLRERRRRWLAAAALVGALQVVTGSPEILLLSLAMALGWGAAFPYGEGAWPRGRRVAASLLLASAVAGLAAIQIIPSLPVVRGSSRMQPRPFSSFAVWSLSPKRLPELVVPGFLGRTDSLAAADYWGSGVEDESFPLFLSVYFGAGALTLGAWAALSRRPAALPWRFRIFLGGCGVLAVLLALGRFFPLLPALYRVAPWLGLFRHPSKFLAAATLPAALLAAQGVEAGFAAKTPPARSLRILLSAVALCLLAGWLAFAGSETFASWLARVFFDRSPGPTLRSGVASGLGQAALITAALALLALRPARSGDRWPIFAVAAVLVMDLATAGSRVNPVGPKSLLEEAPPAAVGVRRDVGEGRLFRDENPPGVVLRAPSNDILWQDAWNRETLYSYLGAAFDIPVIFHADFDGLEQSRLANLTRVLRRLPWARRLPILSAGAVTLVVTPNRLALTGLEPIGAIPNASNVAFYLYRNAGAAPRAGFVTSWDAVASEADSVRAMLRPGFDPRRQAVIEGVRAVPPRPTCPDGAITRLEHRPVAQRYRVDAGCDGYAVFAEPLTAGWRARVDGRPVPIRRANSAFSAIWVSAGSHVLDREYRPAEVPLGAAVSLVTLAALAAPTLRGKVGRPPGPHPEEAATDGAGRRIWRTSQSSQNTAAHQGPDQPGR